MPGPDFPSRGLWPARATGAIRRCRTTLAALLLALVSLAAAAGAALASPGQDLRTVEAGAELRAEPRSDAEVLLALTPEHRLVEFERRDGWIRIGVFGGSPTFGWVAADQVVPVARTAALPAAPVEVLEAEPDAAPARIFRLAVTGSPAVLYRGDCRLVGAAGDEKSFKFSGYIPETRAFEGGALSCVVQKWDSIGRLNVRLYDDEALVAHQTTGAPYNYLRVRSDGPWGAAAAVRGDFPRLRKPRKYKPKG